MTRAIGDNDVIGVSHEPEITSEIISFAPDERIFVLSASDGLTEMTKNGEVNDADYVKRLVEAVLQDKKIFNVNSLSGDLAKQAMRDGSGDNLTIMAVELNPKMEETLAVNIFDGHGGAKVSSGLGNDFLPTVSGLALLEAKLYHTKAEIDELLREIADGHTEPTRKQSLRFVKQQIETRMDENEIRGREMQIQILFIRTLESELSTVPEVKQYVDEYKKAINKSKTKDELQLIYDKALGLSNIPDMNEMPERLRSTHIMSLSNEGFSKGLKDMQVAFRQKAITARDEAEKKRLLNPISNATSSSLFTGKSTPGESQQTDIKVKKPKGTSPRGSKQ